LSPFVMAAIAKFIFVFGTSSDLAPFNLTDPGEDSKLTSLALEEFDTNADDAAPIKAKSASSCLIRTNTASRKRPGSSIPNMNRDLAQASGEAISAVATRRFARNHLHEAQTDGPGMAKRAGIR